MSLQLLEEVGDGFAGGFGVVDGDFGAFVGAFADFFGGLRGVVTGYAEGVFGAVGSLDDDGLSAFADFFYRTIYCLYAVFADAVDFDAGLLGALCSVVNDNFRTLL